MATPVSITPVKPSAPRCKKTLRRVYWIDAQTVDALNADGGPAVSGSVIEGLISNAEVLRDLKDDSRSHVQLVRFGGRLWVRKRIFTPSLKTRLYHRLRLSPAWREFKGARRLRALGRRVGAPMLLVHERRKKRRRSQTLFTPYSEGPSLQQAIANAPPPSQWTHEDCLQRRRVAEAIGRQIGALLADEVVNRDHKPSNLILDDKCLDEGAEPVIIDVGGLRERRDRKQVFRALAVLWRSATRSGHVTPREGLRCLNALLETYPRLIRGKKKRLRRTLRGVKAQLKWRDDQP